MDSSGGISAPALVPQHNPISVHGGHHASSAMQEKLQGRDVWSTNPQISKLYLGVEASAEIRNGLLPHVGIHPFGQPRSGDGGSDTRHHQSPQDPDDPLRLFGHDASPGRR